jgi:hypothetical protein
LGFGRAVVLAAAGVALAGFAAVAGLAAVAVFAAAGFAAAGFAAAPGLAGAAGRGFLAAAGLAAGLGLVADDVPATGLRFAAVDALVVEERGAPGAPAAGAPTVRGEPDVCRRVLAAADVGVAGVVGVSSVSE